MDRQEYKEGRSEVKRAFYQLGEYAFAAIVAVLTSKIMEFPTTWSGALAGGLLLLVFLILLSYLYAYFRKSGRTLTRECPTESCNVSFEIRDLHDLDEYEAHVWDCYSILPDE